MANKYQNYLTTFHKADLIKIIEDEDAKKHFSIYINFLVLAEQEPDIVQKVLNEPEECFEAFDSACVRAQMSCLKEVKSGSHIKSYVHCRMSQLPGMKEIRRTVIPANADVGKFLQISGTVMRITASRILEYRRMFMCTKCQCATTVLADFEKRFFIEHPKICQALDPCDGKNLLYSGEVVPENCKDYQEVKIQEQVEQLGLGNVPSNMWIALEDDLVDICKPGDNITVCGVLKRRWNELSSGKIIEMELVLKANNVEVDNNINGSNLATPEAQKMFDTFWEKYELNPLVGRDIIVKSFCPEIHGLYFVKLALAVVLAGGTTIEDNSDEGPRTRAESHMLLVGDPGIGKSHMLHFAAKVIPRAVLTTGVGSTAAGLTVTAIMEDGMWQLEAGALVMADGGVCCIDEFGFMREHDRTCIHEAMEQQTISVAKASIVCKLNTRCSIIAACNPKSNIDSSTSIHTSINIPSPLLSRFDLIMVLKDNIKVDWDTEIAEYILNECPSNSKFTDIGVWTVDMLQAYFVKIKKLRPKLTDEAQAVLSSYYKLQRQFPNRNKARTTVRLLESLVRLSQGHAKLMLHEKVEIMDAVYAVALVDASMEKPASILKLELNTGSGFPENPNTDYNSLLVVILGRLQLPQILCKETARLSDTAKLRGVQSKYFQTKFSGENKENVPGNYQPQEEIIVSKTGGFDMTTVISDPELIELLGPDTDNKEINLFAVNENEATSDINRGLFQGDDLIDEDEKEDYSLIDKALEKLEQMPIASTSTKPDISSLVEEIKAMMVPKDHNVRCTQYISDSTESAASKLKKLRNFSSDESVQSEKMEDDSGDATDRGKKKKSGNGSSKTQAKKAKTSTKTKPLPFDLKRKHFTAEDDN